MWGWNLLNWSLGKKRGQGPACFRNMNGNSCSIRIGVSLAAILISSVGGVPPGERPALSCNVAVTLTRLDLSDGLPGRWVPDRQEDVRFIQDRSRIEVWTTRREFQGGVLQEDGFETRLFWDGERLGLQQRQARPKDPDKYLAFVSGSFEDQIRNSASYGNFLDGYVDSMDPGIGVYETFADGAAKVEQLGEEVVDGHSCRVVRVLTAERTVTAWVDLSLGGCCRRYEIVRDKKVHPGFAAKGRNEEGQSLRCVAELAYAPDQPIPVATEGVYLVERRDSAGELILSSRLEAKRSNIRFNPDLEALKAFKFDLPPGYFVNNLDNPVHFTWTGDKLVAYLDQAVLDSIQEELGSADAARSVTSASTSAPASSTEHAVLPVAAEPAGGERETTLWWCAALGGAAMLLGCVVVWRVGRCQSSTPPVRH